MGSQSKGWISRRYSGFGRDIQISISIQIQIRLYSHHLIISFLQLDKMVGGLKKGGGAGGKVTTQNTSVFISLLSCIFLLCFSISIFFQPYPPGQLPRPNSLNDFNEVEEEVKFLLNLSVLTWKYQSRCVNYIVTPCFRGGILVKWATRTSWTSLSEC